MTASQFFRIVEIRTKLVSVSGVTIGTLWAAYRHGDVPVGTLLVYLAAVLAVDMATTGFNTFFDYYHAVDRRDTNRESDKILVHQGVAAGPALLVSLILYGVAAILGVILAVIATPWVVPVGVASMVVGYLYNAGPLPISRTPLGELFAGGFLGWVLVELTIYVLAGSAMQPAELLVGVPSFLFVASVLSVNNTCDIAGDRAAGRRTLSIILGPRGGAALVYGLGGAAFATVAILSGIGVYPRIALAGAVVGAGATVPVYRGMHRRGFSHATKGPSMQAVSRGLLILTASIAVPFAVVLIVG